MGKPTVVSLFSGCGGFDLGFIWAGFDVLWANDFDHWACETYRRNIGDHIVEGDVTEIDLNTLPHADVVIGGFPCQDFSMTGKRAGMNGKRGDLYLEMASAIERVRPRIFIAENVMGILSANNGQAIEQIRNDFAELDYHVQVQPINFADYGVAQNRRRILIVGTHKLFHFPLGKHYKNPVSVEQVLTPSFEGVQNCEPVKMSPLYKQVVWRIKQGGSYYDIDASNTFHPYSARRAHLKHPAPTVTTQTGSGAIIHPIEDRNMTNRECARLFGFSDKFVFCGGVHAVRKQIGNSVPPVGMKPIADRVRAWLERYDDLPCLPKIEVERYEQMVLI